MPARSLRNAVRRWLRNLPCGTALGLLFLAAAPVASAQQPDLPPPITIRAQPDIVRAGGLELTNLEAVRAALAVTREARATMEREQREGEELYDALGVEIAALEDREAMELERSQVPVWARSVDAATTSNYVLQRDNARDGVSRFLEQAVTVPLQRIEDNEAIAARIDEQYEPAFREQAAKLAAQRDELQTWQTRGSRIAGEGAEATTRGAASQQALVELRARRAAAGAISERERQDLDRQIQAHERAESHWNDKLRWLEAELEPVVRRKAGVKQIEVELADYRMQLRQKELEAARSVLDARLEAARQQDAEDARQARRDLEAAGDEPEFRRIQLREKLAAEELELEASRLLERKVVDANQASDLTATLADLRSKDQRLRASYRQSEADERPSGAEAETELAQLREAMSATGEVERDLDARRLEYKARSEEIAAAIDTFDSRTNQILVEAQAAYDAHAAVAPPDARPPDWEVVSRDLRASRVAQRGQFDRLQDELEDGRAVLRGALETLRTAQAERRQLRGLLQRENITLRSVSKISIESLEQGLKDLASLPGYLGDVASAVGSYLVDPAHSDGVYLYLAMVVVGAIASVLLRRRLQTWIDQLSAMDLADRSDRAALTAAYLLRALVLGAYLAMLFAGAAWALAGLPPDVESLLRRLGFLVGAFWLVRRINHELFQPKPAERAVLELDPVDARRMFVAVGLLLYATLIALPLPLALKELGYRNEGLLELLALVAKIGVAVVALVVVSRQSLWASILPSESSGPARLLRGLGRAARRVVMLLIPTLVVLEALQFDILAGLITRVAVVTLAVSLAGFLIYQLGLFVVDRLLLPPPEKARESAADRRRREGMREFLVFVLLLGVLFGGMSTALRLSGSTLADLRSFFDVRLPLTSITDAGLPSVTWWNLIVACFLIWFFVALTRRVKLMLHDVVLPGTGMDAGLRYTLTTLTGYMLIALGIYLALTEVFNLDNLGYVLAAFSVGIGFGLQEVVSNFVSGLILLFERPLRVGDMVKVGETLGTVQKINIRATTVVTLDNVWILVPNKDFITQNVVNYVYTDAKLRCVVPVGVAYGSDTDKVREILVQVGKDHPLVLSKPAPEVRFEGFGDSSLDFSLLAWINDPFDRPRVMSDLNFAIDQGFRKGGVEIPFPQRDLHLRSAEVPLRVARGEDAEPPVATPDAPDAPPEKA